MKEPRTDEELKQIAQDLLAGKIFCDRHCSNEQELRTVFMPIALMNAEMAKDLAENNIEFVYEYLDKAGPRSCNGMPMFFSFQYLSKDEFLKMIKYHDAIKAAIDNVSLEEEEDA